MQGTIRELAVGPDDAEQLKKRLHDLRSAEGCCFSIRWEAASDPNVLLGEAQLERRVQPFTLVLGSLGAHPVLRCISPVGRFAGDDDEEILEFAGKHPTLRIGLIETDLERTYDLTVEGDVMLADFPEYDLARLNLLLTRVLRNADELEQTLHPGDAPLSQFRIDLEGESRHGR